MQLRIIGAALTAVVMTVVVVRCSERGRSGGANLKDANLIIINIDALRADHLGLYGYGRDTSPFIDRLAAEGVVFERARSNSSYTRESVSVLFSGELPSASGSVGWTAKPTADAPHLAQMLHDTGYRTGFFSATTMLTDPQFTAGFDVAEDLTTAWGVSGLGSKLSERAAEFIKQCAGQKFMLYLHYLDPHGPYDPPPDLYRRFPHEMPANPVDVYRDVRPNLVALRQQGFGPGEARFEDMVVRYDAEIADTDRAIERLFGELDRLHVRDRTLVVLSADHGEEFLDHDFVEHAWTLYEESLQVPLIIWAPGILRPQRVDGSASVVDILPTVLQLLEIPHGRTDLDGHTLAERREASWTFQAPAGPLVAELLITQRNVLRTMIDGKWKYIAAQRWLTPDERPAAIKLQNQQPDGGGGASVDIWGPTIREELYDLAADPREQRDVLGAFPQEHQRLHDQLQSAMDRWRRRHPRASGEPLEPADAERLRALGYLGK